MRRRQFLAGAAQGGLVMLAASRAAAWPLPVPAAVGFEPRRRHRLEWAGVHVYQTALSPGGGLCLGAGDGGSVRVWDTLHGTPVRDVPATGAAFLPDGRRLALWRGRSVAVVGVAAGQDEARWDEPAAVAAVAVSPDGQRLACALEGGPVRVAAPAGGPGARLEGHTDTATVVFAPDGRRLLTASDGDRTVRLWEAATGRQIRLVHDFQGAAPVPGNNLVLTPAFVGDGARLAVCAWGKEKAVRLWDAATGTLVLTRELEPDHHKDAALDPDGRWLATVHEDRTVRVRALASGEELWREELAEVYVPRAPAWSADGRFLICGSHRGWAYLWRLLR